MSFKIVRDNIIKVKADAIVATVSAEETATMGDVIVVKSFSLHQKYIFKVSGPVWLGGDKGEKDVLRECYDKALAMAIKLNCNSIAFPLISSGNNGFPKDEALKVALAAFNSFLLENEIEVILVVYDKDSTRLSEKLFGDVHKYIDDNYVEAHKGANRLFTNRGTMLPPQGNKGILANTRLESFENKFVKREAQRKIGEVAELHRTIPSGAKEMLVECSAEMVEPIPFPSAKSFTEYIIQLLNKKGIDNSEAYKASNMTRQYFSKLISGKIAPSKDKMLDLAIGLKLNLDETKDLLGCAGYAISRFSKSDLLYEYYIKNGIYDLNVIHCNLFDEGLYTKDA